MVTKYTDATNGVAHRKVLATQYREMWVLVTGSVRSKGAYSITPAIDNPARMKITSNASANATSTRGTSNSTNPVMVAPSSVTPTSGLYNPIMCASGRNDTL